MSRRGLARAIKYWGNNNCIIISRRDKLLRRHWSLVAVVADDSPILITPLDRFCDRPRDRLRTAVRRINMTLYEQQQPVLTVSRGMRLTLSRHSIKSDWIRRHFA